MAFEFSNEYDTEVPVKVPSRANSTREIKLPVTFSLLTEGDYQSMLKAVNGPDLEESNSWLYKMVKAVGGIGGTSKDDKGNPIELDPTTEGVDFAINHPLIRRAIVKKYVTLSQSNTFQG